MLKNRERRAFVYEVLCSKKGAGMKQRLFSEVNSLDNALTLMLLNPPEEIKTSILDTFDKEPPILCVKK